MQHTEHQRLELAKQVCSLYAEGIFVLESCCLNVGLSPRTFRHWTVTVATIADSFSEAKRERLSTFKAGLRERSLTALERLTSGYTLETRTVTTDSEGKVTTRVTTKEYGPVPAAVLFAIDRLNALEIEQGTDSETGEDAEVYNPEELRSILRLLS